MCVSAVHWFSSTPSTCLLHLLPLVHSFVFAIRVLVAPLFVLCFWWGCLLYLLFLVVIVVLLPTCSFGL